MSCFTTVSAVTAAGDLDSTKHVNYTAGMILGVRDFEQEFAYLAGRDRWLARDALGFGTVSGLSVKIEKDGDKGYRVMISSGVALSRRGQLICVPAAQCAYLNQWLAANIENLPRNNTTSPPLSPPLTSPYIGNEVTLYVVLCYRDCLTDNVPIPGEPCRNEDELMAPSRVKDDFSLELRLKAPDQPEEKAVRDYVGWLKEIKIVDTGASTSIEDFERAIRERWLSLASPPISSPPPILQINEDDVCEYMRTAFRIWVTELRDVLSDRKTGCCSEMSGGTTLDDCVLLAELRIPLTPVSPGWQVSETEEIVINQENRPFLLHLRMLQEWMLCGCHCAAETIPPIISPPIISPPIISPPIASPPIMSPPIVSPPITSPSFPPAHNHNLDSLTDVRIQSPVDGQILTFRSGEWIAEAPPVHNHTLDGLSDVDVSSATQGQVLVFKNGFWVPETRPTTGGVSDHGNLSGLADDDHPQYLLTNGSRVLTGDLQGGGKRIVNLAAANANGQAVIFQQAIKQNDSAGGDLGGTYPNPTIAKLQGNPISATPTEGQILIFKGGKWIAEDPVNPTGGVTDHGLLTGLADDDHKQYLLIDGSRAMKGDLNCGTKRIIKLARGTGIGDAVNFEQAVKQDDAAGGDLGGLYPNPSVEGLQGNPVEEKVPNLGDVLTWQEEEGKKFWTPRPAQASESNPYIILPLATVSTGFDNRRYEVWFNIDAPGNMAEITDIAELKKYLTVVAETDVPAGGTNPLNFFSLITVDSIVRKARNVFDVTLKDEAEYMRFRFDIGKIHVKVHGTTGSMFLDKYAESNSIKFAGFENEEMGFATIFVRGVPRNWAQN